tara:strand:- start:25 stop:402 length:378 start_codon:yes stop_codon:yes gene_type:complete
MRRQGRIPPPVPPNSSNENKAQIERVKKLMVGHIGLRRANPNVLPNNVNKNNVSTYYNSNFSNSESKNIPKNKRVYISKDVVKGKVKHVYNQDGIIKILLRSKNFSGASPISRKRFSIKNVIPFT